MLWPCMQAVALKESAADNEGALALMEEVLAVRRCVPVPVPVPVQRTALHCGAATA